MKAEYREARQSFAEQARQIVVSKVISRHQMGENKDDSGNARRAFAG